MEELYVRNSIKIEASLEKVWDVLTKAEYTKQYMFNCEPITDWKVGSDLLWEGTYEGQTMVFVKGKIIEINLPQKLVYTTIDPNSAMEDKPENYLFVTYELGKDENGTLLKVSQGDYSKVYDGENRYKHSYNNGEGWMPILIQIKNIAEK